MIGDNAQCRGRWQWQIFPYVKNEQVFTCPNISGNKWSAATSTNGAPCNPADRVGRADVSGYGWSGALNYDCRASTYPACPGYNTAEIKKPAATLIVGDVTFDREAGYYMYAKNPALAGTAGASPWYYPNFRHNVSRSVAFTANVAGRTGRNFSLPVAGRANFTFLDGHAKSLDVGTAFEEAPRVGGNYVEDNQRLNNTAAPNEANRYDSHYVLWNIY